MEKITAVVVTYNRKELLFECLDALLAQTRKVDKIILINNASTDGTVEDLTDKGYLNNKELQLVTLDTNTGGSGGFYEGMRLASQDECDWIWVMDDDTIPNKDALEALLNAKNSIDANASFYASSVFGPNGEPMNVPRVSTHKASNGYQDWYQNLSKNAVEIKEATFVSLLINKKAVVSCGLPCKDYFIWGDDAEYTMRIITHFGKAYFIGNSIVCHKRFGATNLDIRKEANKGRVKMYYYFYRNNLINRSIYSSKHDVFKFMLGGVRTSITSLKTKNGFYKFRTVYKGIGGYFSNKGRFKSYIKNQLKVK